MTESTFETMFAAHLREYADGGVRPIDRYAIAEGTIKSTPARGRLSRWAPGWRARPLNLLLVGLLIVALAASAVVVGGRLLAPAPILPAPRVYLNELGPAADLSTPRFQPTLVVLEDDRVLVIGGNAGLSTTAEIYDVDAGESTAVGPMVSADFLVVSSAVRLADGRVLIVGDARPGDAPSFAVSQVFDPVTLRFDATGPMVTPRTYAELALLPDGRVLVTGGTRPVDINTTLATAELFDPTTSTFSATGSMATSRSFHAVTTLADGRVMVIGGETSTGDGAVPVTSAEIYDPETGTFTAADTMSSARSGLHAIALEDGRVVCFRSSMGDPDSDVQTWDPTTGRFGALSRLDRNVVGATLLDDGRILLIGVPTRNDTWAGTFDLSSKVVLTDVQAPVAWWPSVVRLADGRVLVVGGLEDGSVREANGGQLAPAVPMVQIFQ